MDGQHRARPEGGTEEASGRRLAGLTLGALGVVYGDIGTSPLYALRECFRGPTRVAPTGENVLGVLSLIFWALMVVVSVKYLLFVMRADNRGEGGILALLALLHPWRKRSRRHHRWLVLLGLFGAALLYGDGAITPAISVLSAIEGMGTVTPALGPYVVPATVGTLLLLFLFQKRGTAGVGAVFGPVMVVWFLTLAALGAAGIAREPSVLRALSPLPGIAFFRGHGQVAFTILSAVFLVVTGGEALYADMGHFGLRPIRLAWFGLVLPSLLLNYFGQGAVLLLQSDGAAGPFFDLAPRWALYPLVLLATMATVIASQAVISGTFSLTRQAVQLGHCPRVRIVQTSPEQIGQIYIPGVNLALMVATVGLVVSFRSSGALAAAYGVAVSTTMVITTVLAFFVALERWRWHWLVASLVALALLVIDLAFAASNAVKIEYGGWVPLALGAVVFTAMTTWRRGRELVLIKLQRDQETIEAFVRGLAAQPPLRVPGTAVFMSSSPTGVPPMLRHHLRHMRVLHEQVVLLTVLTEEVPHVPLPEALEVTEVDQGFFRVRVRYGFMQSPNIPGILGACRPLGLTLDPAATTFYLGRETLIPIESVPGMAVWREKLFAFMARNCLRATAFYQIPPANVVELGLQLEI